MIKENLIMSGVIAVSVFIITVIAEFKLIPILKSHKVGQKILEIGPRWHIDKNGTPIMGGLGFILATLIVMAIAYAVAWFKGKNSLLIPLALTYGLAIFNGAVGYMDDYTKLIKKQNEGFKEYQKLILQFLIAILYVVAMVKTGCLGTKLELPFTSSFIDLGWFYYIIVVLFIVALVNSANFTDGIDGLLSSVGAIISIFLTILGFLLLNEGLIMLSSALFGGACGFLVFNLYPAKVFMGDTGSLYIGGTIAGAAVMTNEIIIVLIMCVIFVCEMASVILQRGYYKLTHGKRIFKMAPIHHHFEMCGWIENKIVVVFSIITLLFCVLAIVGI